MNTQQARWQGIRGRLLQKGYTLTDDSNGVHVTCPDCQQIRLLMVPSSSEDLLKRFGECLECDAIRQHG